MRHQKKILNLLLLATTLVFALLSTPIRAGAANDKSDTAYTGSALNATLTEEEKIPVILDSKEKSPQNSRELYWRICFAVGIVASMFLGGVILLKKYRSADFSKNQTHEIKVLRQHHLSPKKSLAIVRVAGESLLIGVTEQNISMLKSLSLLDEDIPAEPPPQHFEISEN